MYSYILLRDLPGLPSGAIFNPDKNMYINEKTKITFPEEVVKTNPMWWRKGILIDKN